MSAPEGKFTQETPEMALLEKKMASKCFRVVLSNNLLPQIAVVIRLHMLRVGIVIEVII